MGLHGKVLITGGAGFLGRAIIRRSMEEKWDCEISVFSSDPTKHAKLPPNIHCYIGDVRDETAMMLAMQGKDIVIHAAAVKQIPESEVNPIDCYHVNVEGSENVGRMAIVAGVKQVLAISTDKAAKPANAYGDSKMMMEKMWCQFASIPSNTTFHLVRYGNVLDSTASVLTKWRQAQRLRDAIEITDPAMTRFWISPDKAVDYVLAALNLSSGFIYVPKMKSLSIGKMADYVLGEGEYDYRLIPIRPGEKIHEELLTFEEREHAIEMDDYFILEPSTAPLRNPCRETPYTSFNAPRFTRDEFLSLF